MRDINSYLKLFVYVIIYSHFEYSLFGTLIKERYYIIIL